jgi:hypothetical protein
MTNETNAVRAGAVAWMCDAGDGVNIDATCRTNVRDDYARFGRTIDPLYPASVVAALEGEVAYYKENFLSCMATLNAINNATIEADEEGRGFVPVHQLQAALTQPEPAK